jgi:hypothetical protein
MKDAGSAFCIVERLTPDNTNPKKLGEFVLGDFCRILEAKEVKTLSGRLESRQSRGELTV